MFYRLSASESPHLQMGKSQPSKEEGEKMHVETATEEETPNPLRGQCEMRTAKAGWPDSSSFWSGMCPLNEKE